MTDEKPIDDVTEAWLKAQQEQEERLEQERARIHQGERIMDYNYDRAMEVIRNNGMPFPYRDRRGRGWITASQAMMMIDMLGQAMTSYFKGEITTFRMIGLKATFNTYGKMPRVLGGKGDPYYSDAKGERAGAILHNSLYWCLIMHGVVAEICLRENEQSGELSSAAERRALLNEEAAKPIHYGKKMYVPTDYNFDNLSEMIEATMPS